MNNAFDTTAWLLQTLLILIGLLAALPLLRALAGLAIVLATRAAGRQRSQAHAYGLSLLPKFARALLGAGLTASLGAGFGLGASPATASAPPLVIDRVVSLAESAQDLEDQPVGLPLNEEPRIHRVRAGDTLWSIARAELGRTQRTPSNQEIDRAWRRLWLENLTTVGDDPSLIYPGQRLRIPQDLHAD